MSDSLILRAATAVDAPTVAAIIAAAFEEYRGTFVNIDVLLTWGTSRFASTPVNHRPREQGTSGYTFLKLMTHAMNMMTGFSTMPLQMASLIGFVFTLFGFFVLTYVVVRYFAHGDPVPGFPFLASVVALAIRPGTAIDKNYADD